MKKVILSLLVLALMCSCMPVPEEKHEVKSLNLPEFMWGTWTSKDKSNTLILDKDNAIYITPTSRIVWNDCGLDFESETIGIGTEITFETGYTINIVKFPDLKSINVHFGGEQIGRSFSRVK